MYDYNIHSEHAHDVERVSQKTASSAPAPVAPTVNIEPWNQWLANDGYCGESCFLSAGLYYGEYASQYDIRQMAVGNTKGSTQKNDELSFENNENPPKDNSIPAAEGMNFDYDSYDGSGGVQGFEQWMSQEVNAGHPVVIGVYMNGSVFGEKSDLDFDHIVTVTGIDMTSNPPTITFCDNGLYTGDGSTSNYTYTENLDDFVNTRKGADKSSAGVYSLPDDVRNYGIAITGVKGSEDPSNKLVPIQITTDKNEELPAMKDGSTTRPAAETLNLNITLSDLTPGQTYTIYRYNDMSQVPGSDFNANSGDAAEKITFTATSSTYTFNESIQSDEQVAYRAVPTDAP